ncbi:hypothetical protein B0H17DRAFT_573465 [Mycena rosella]|uniref:SnoaL-like domain-containing protein n=1 Tax=Mycena rosella TaxID=1033263 RepID=A0AAD7M9T4_MYCRO|nr:hypothetical protein B0H17DRAFT_573465 [Mycena rosella]
MAFTLTKDHVHSIVDAATRGDMLPFMTAADPELRWVIGSEKKDAARMTGAYTLASWGAEIGAPLRARLKDGVVKMNVTSVDVIGNKAFVEWNGEATQLNGAPYNNIWVLIFSEKTGKIVEIREYLDTALVQEVVQTNPL